ncbi:MAG: aminopeptidase P family protein [Chlorobiaceae bacterium]|nr:aminopeptidase P family protein [Chlorobiaceae bacterium]
MKNKIILEKQQQAISILKEKNIDLWLIFVRESSTMRDPILEIIVGTNVTWQSAFLINSNGDRTAIIGSLDVANMKTVGTFENIEGYVKSVREPLLNYLNKYKPKKIAINYSTNSNLADGLTYGMFLILNKMLEGTEFKERLISSEEIISALRGRKSKAEIEFIKSAIVETEKIFDEVTKFLKAGLSEKDVAEFILSKVEVKGFELAWDKDHCPAVFTGPNSAGAHAGPTNSIIEKGHILNIDFGIKYNGYCSDMQRTWYFLRDDETEAPENVKKGFEVLRDSIQKAKEKIKPGVAGCEVDDVSRNYIKENGFDEYQHGLGHQLGRSAHDGGGGLFPRWERYGNLPFLEIEVGQVFTIEPRLFVKDHGIVTMEEIITVTENGCEYLSHPQRELWLIK